MNPNNNNQDAAKNGDQQQQPPAPKKPASTGSVTSVAARQVKPGKSPPQRLSIANPRIGSQPSNPKTTSSGTTAEAAGSSNKARRQDSGSSMSSVGIGPSGQMPAKLKINENIPPKLVAEGDTPSGAAVFDCIVYVIYCPTHDRFAVTNIERSRVAWFPFIALQQDLTYAQAAQEGLSQFLGRRDAGTDQEDAFKMPKYSQNLFFHVLHVHLPSDRSFIRLAYFVQVEQTDGYKCCEPTIKLNWLSACDIMDEKVEMVWGPELRIFVELLVTPKPIFIEEIARGYALQLLSPSDRSTLYQSKLLKNAQVNQEMILAMFEDFIEHCFPATYMSLESFKAYMMKHGYARTDARFLWIFNAIGYNQMGYLDFNEFLIGILCLEPNTEHTEARIRMLFRYYSVTNKQVLTLNELLALFRDVNQHATMEQLHGLVEHAKSYGYTNDQLTYEAFHKAISSNKLKGTGPLCRSVKPIMPQVLASFKAAKEKASGHGGGAKPDTAEDPAKKAAAAQAQAAKRKGRGICNGCRAQNVEYCLHTVYLDMQGNCQKPLLIKEVINDGKEGGNVMTPMRYSKDIVFSVESLYRMFVDTIREAATRGEPLMIMPEEHANFGGYVQSLCENLSDMLSNEERLIRTNAPCMVIGDIGGNLTSLMAMERALWQSIPVLHSNLIFLGNYVGPNKFSVEVLCYMFALKMLSPNKVFILRGANETREESRATLYVECEQRYGAEIGKFIWDRLNETMDRLPVAVVIDESIFCVHSGVPKSSSAVLAKFYSIPEVIQNVEKESPLAYELLYNVPSETGERSFSEKDPSTSSNAPTGGSTKEGTNTAGGVPPGGNKRSEFSSGHFCAFLKTNNLTHMIRSGELPRDGYRMQFNCRCITVSSVREPTVVFVDGSSATIRLVRIALDEKNVAGAEAKETTQGVGTPLVVAP